VLFSLAKAMIMLMAATLFMAVAMLVAMILSTQGVVIMMRMAMIRMAMMFMIMMRMAMMRLERRMISVPRLLRFEGGRDRNSGHAQLGEDGLNLGDLLEANARSGNLDRQMAIAERPDQPRCLREVLFAYLEQWLDIRDDFRAGAVIEEQQIVGAQMRRGRKIQLDARTPVAEHKTMLAMAVGIGQLQSIGDLCR
jgi:hypothetical protein